MKHCIRLQKNFIHCLWRINKVLRKILAIFIIILSLNCSANADVFEHPQTLSVISSQIPEFKNTKCRFTQEKIIPNSTVKIKSSGIFIFDKSKGVTFNTTYPTTFTTSYTSSEYKQISDIFNAISNKSYSKIEKVFKFYFCKVNNEWQLGFKPKAGYQATKYLTSIEIRGDYSSTKMMMIIKSTNGTKTTTWFSK